MFLWNHCKVYAKTFPIMVYGLKTHALVFNPFGLILCVVQVKSLFAVIFFKRVSSFSSIIYQRHFFYPLCICGSFNKSW